jgi:type IV/VI secretion system ImpK/VasF family protein
MELSEIAQPIYLFASTFKERVERGDNPTPDLLMAELRQMFDKMDGQARQNALLHDRYSKLRYGLIALADETIANSSWAHKTSWKTLEMAMCQTNIAGDHVYEIIDALGHGEPDLIEGYFYVLSLGFRGKYLLDEQGYASNLQRLYQMMPKKPGMDDFRLTPDAYRVLRKMSQKLDPLFSLWRSVILFVICLIMVIVFYQTVWITVVSEARSSAIKIVDAIDDPALQKEYRRKLGFDGD